MKMRIRDSRGLKTELLKDLLFPARCPICSDAILLKKRAALYAGAETFAELYDGLVCPECRRELGIIRPPFCSKCGKQLETEGLCGDCASAIRRFESCRCVIRYDETAREMMTAVKYHSAREYLDFLGVLAADRLGDWIRSVQPAYLVPVPVHESRLRTRGYNQAAVLAEVIGRLVNVPVNERILVRNKRTKAQKELGARDRLVNLQNAFGIGEQPVRDAKYMIIDDIYTTGATLESCTELLLDAGAGAVYGLCICAGEASDGD